LLISLIPLSYMVVPNRDLANTLFPFIIDIPNNLSIPSIIIPIDIEIDILRGRLISNSPNSSRESSTHSNMLSMVYIDRVQALANSPTWADQVENKKFQSSSLFYATIKEGENSSTNLVLIIEPTHTPYEMISNDITTTYSLELMVILYAINQLIDPQLWYGNFCPTPIFSITEYLEDNIKNITCLLYRIAAFVRQCKLEDKDAKNISPISKFSFVALDFLLAVYESG